MTLRLTVAQAQELEDRAAAVRLARAIDRDVKRKRRGTGTKAGESVLERQLRQQLRDFGIGGWVQEAHLLGDARRVDFAWPEAKLAAEIDGGIYQQGGHNRGAQIEADAAKVSELVARGWRVLRLTAKTIESGQALRWIERSLGKEG